MRLKELGGRFKTEGMGRGRGVGVKVWGRGMRGEACWQGRGGAGGGLAYPRARG